MTRVRAMWTDIRDSLWFLPAMLTAAAAGLAVLTVRLDRTLLDDRTFDPLPWFVFEAGAEGARGVLSTIAGSIITVTGVVFSITIVALQLASSQFTPRVLRSFTSDRSNQVVLGVFIGTFTYALLVLRTVRSAIDDYERFVPSISVTVALALALVSIGFLIYFVNHIARSIQAEVIIDRVTRDALQAVDTIFPESIGADAHISHPVDLPAETPLPVLAEESGYLQSIDEHGVLDIASEGRLVLRIEKKIGSFVLAGDTLASVWPAAAGGSFEAGIRNAFGLGAERTHHQDVERGIIELTDIGIRALSPGVNDPTTAIVCIDRLSEILARLGSRRFPDEARVGDDGELRVLAPSIGYQQVVDLSYGQLRHHATGDPAVTIRLLEALGRVARRIPLQRREPLNAEIAETVLAARRAVTSTADLGRIENAGTHAHVIAGES